MSYDTRNPRRRPIYAPPPAPSSRHHSVLGYWVPLLVTGTIAIGGLAAWVWSERNSHDEDDYPPPSKPSRPPPSQQPSFPGPGPMNPGPPGQGGAPMPPYAGPLPSQSAGGQGMPPPVGGEASSYYNATSTTSRDEQQREHDSTREDSTFFGQVRGAMRRTPSPQQLMDQASRTVGAGVAAAGKALGSIMEEDGHGNGFRDQSEYRSSTSRRDETHSQQGREGFSDHERWSEEAEDMERKGKSSFAVGGEVEASSVKRADELTARNDKTGKQRKRTVAIVVSADTNMDGKMDEEDVVYSEHASILSHLPEHHDSDMTDMFVLIYAPGLTSLPPLNYRPQLLTHSHTPTTTPGSEEPPSNFPSPGRQFDALFAQALSLVSSPTHILPFTTTTGYVPILRHLAPQIVYVSDLLAGDEGRTVQGLKGWVGHTVLVAGDDATGGLADTETEDETPTGMGAGRRPKWYDDSAFVGLGKEVEVVDAARMGDDWGRRVGGRQ